MFAQGTGQPTFRMHATSLREFAIPVVRATVTFEVDRKGTVTGLVLHQGGADHRARRKKGAAVR
jgi:hypothetical protein